MLLAFCEGNPLVINGFPSQKTSSTGFDIFFDVSLNKLLNKHASSWLFDSLWHTCESVCKFIAISILFRACKKSEERRHFASQSALEKVGDICRLQEGTSWGMRGGGGGVVVVVLWWWDVHEGRPAGVFLVVVARWWGAGGCGSLRGLGQLEGVDFGGCEFGGPSVWHCIANQCTVKPTGHLLGDFVLLLISTFLSFSALETTTRKKKKARMAMSYACPMR